MEIIFFALIIGFAIITTASHAAGLIWAQRHAGENLARREKAWRRHLLITGNLWRVLALATIAAQAYFFNEISLASLPIGIILVVLGLYLSASSYFALGGFAAAMGEWFFFPKKQRKWIKSGLYKYLANPMYDGFFLLLIGMGFVFNAPENFYFAAASFVLLNIFLARIESKGHGWKPF